MALRINQSLKRLQLCEIDSTVCETLQKEFYAEHFKNSASVY